MSPAESLDGAFGQAPADSPGHQDKTWRGHSIPQCFLEEEGKTGGAEGGKAGVLAQIGGELATGFPEKVSGRVSIDGKCERGCCLH